MLSIAVSDITSSAAADRFVALVNRFLPASVRFSLSPRPEVRLFGNTSLLDLSSTPMIRRSIPGIASLSEIGRADASAAAWKIEFMNVLRSIIRGPQINFTLVDGDQIVTLVGQYDRALLDVADFEALPEQTAAGALVHEMVEQRGLQLNGQTYYEAHAIALPIENQIVGATRLEAQEKRSLPPGQAPQLGERWYWWIPYQEFIGTAIQAVILVLDQYTIVRSEMRHFDDIDAFRRQFDVEMSCVRGLLRV